MSMPRSGDAAVTTARADQRPRQPDHVDRRIGRHLKRCRQARGWSQQALAEACGVSFQQVQKYERGVNRISAARLFTLCDTLDLPVSSFLAEAFHCPSSPQDQLRAELAGSASRLPEDALRHLVALAGLLEGSCGSYRAGGGPGGGGRGEDASGSPAPQ